MQGMTTLKCAGALKFICLLLLGENEGVAFSDFFRGEGRGEREEERGKRRLRLVSGKRGVGRGERGLRRGVFYQTMKDKDKQF